jgi:hypothetical protein
MKGMAAQDPAKPEPRTSKEAVTGYRLFCVVRASGLKTAHWPKKRMNQSAIDQKECPNEGIRFS